MIQTTLTGPEEFRAHVIQHGEETCPTCGHVSRVYTRRLNKAMAKALLWLECTSRLIQSTHSEHVFTGVFTPIWVDVASMAPRDVVRSRELSRLKHWGLVAERPTEKAQKKTSGQWAILPRGVTFVHGSTLEPNKILVLNDERIGEAKGWQGVTIAEVLGLPGDQGWFDFQKLMEESGIGIGVRP